MPPISLRLPTHTLTLFNRILLLTLPLGLAGCGVSFFYNNLDSLVASRLDDFIAFTPNQEAHFEQEFDKLWDWHRSTELPLYASDLERWTQLIDDGVSAADVEQVFTAAEGWWRRIETRSRPISKALVERIKDDQIPEVRQGFDKANAKWDKRTQRRSDEWRQRRWARNFTRLMKRFIGPLDREQKDLVELASRKYQPARAAWRDYRLRWQQEFLTLLESRRDASAFDAAFDTAFERLSGSQELLYSEDLRRVRSENEALTKSLVLDVLRSMDTRQIEKIQGVLAARAEEIRELSQEG